MNQEKTCLDCGSVIHGRADKKFCNDLCRNNYNNQLNSDSYNLIRNVNNILKRNRRVMEELNPGGKTKTTRERMASKGLTLNTSRINTTPKMAKPTTFAMSTAICL